jgi:hypothetical protein
VNQRYGIVELDVALYTDKAAREFTAKVNGTPIVFETIAPGHLQAILRDPIAGTHSFQPSVGTKSLPESSFEVDDSLLGEKTNRGFNLPLLKRLAESSGGLVNPSEAYLNQLSTAKVSSRSFSPILLVSALTLFLLSFAIRWWETKKR